MSHLTGISCHDNMFPVSRAVHGPAKQAVSFKGARENRHSKMPEAIRRWPTASCFFAEDQHAAITIAKVPVLFGDMNWRHTPQMLFREATAALQTGVWSFPSNNKQIMDRKNIGHSPGKKGKSYESRERKNDFTPSSETDLRSAVSGNRVGTAVPHRPDSGNRQSAEPHAYSCAAVRLHVRVALGVGRRVYCTASSRAPVRNACPFPVRCRNGL